MVPSGSGITFVVQNGPENFVGYLKAGGNNDITNSQDGGALRQKLFSGVTVNTSMTTIAHSLVDEFGNPAVPKFVVPVATPGNANDTLTSVKDPDATNIYLAASASGAYDFTVIY